MCRTASPFLLQRLKGSVSGDVRDFNNMDKEFQQVFFFPSRQGAKENSRHSERNITGNMHQRMPPSKTRWPGLNVVVFPPVMRLVLDDQKE